MRSLKETITVNEQVKIKKVHSAAYKIPTATPEEDGTLQWDHTTLVLAEITGGGKRGIGYTYASEASAVLINQSLAALLEGENCMEIPRLTQSLIKQIRNEGSCGIAMMAVSALDIALWDLKAKVLELPLCRLIGNIAEQMPVYGSGGFTCYTDEQTKEQFNKWEAFGIRHLKMKIGAHPDEDIHRVAAAKKAIGADSALFVDANGAYSPKQAIEKAFSLADYGVTWFEEPVPADDPAGLHFIRDHIPGSISIAVGEYGYKLTDFHAILENRATDILQADATRCGGISGFLQAGYLCAGRNIPFSSHCAPSVHLHAALAIPSFYLGEYFFDHVRIEEMLFDGTAPLIDGCLSPDAGKPGIGIDFKRSDAQRFRI